MREAIRDFGGKILGFIDDDGSKLIARNFGGKILGYYYKSENVTKDFFGKTIARGNILSALIMEDNR